MQTNTSIKPAKGLAFIFLFLLLSSYGVSYGQNPPDMDPINGGLPINIVENAGTQTLGLTGITDGDNIAILDPINFSTSSSVPGTIPAPSVNSFNSLLGTADLVFTPNAGQSGQVVLTVTLSDPDGDTDRLLTVNINGIPSFTITPSHASDEDEGPITVPGFVTSFSDGDGGTQNISFVVSNIQQTSGNLTFTSNPAIDATGQLTYQASANTFGQATFDVLIEDDGTPQASSATQTVTINVNPEADTPGVTDASSTNGVQTTTGLVISRNANDDAEVTHFKITGISNGTLYQNNGTTPITDGNFITFAQGNSGLKFTPNSNSDGSFSIQASTAGNDSGLGGAVIQATIFVNGTPSFTITPSHTSNEDQGLVTVPSFATNISDGDGGTQNVSFVVSNIQQTSGTLTFTSAPAIDATGQLTYQASANTFGQATFDVLIEDDGTPQASSATQTVTINVNPEADTPGVTDASSANGVQTTSGLVISRNANDGAEVTHFKITGITNGTLYQNNGATPITDGDFVTFAQGNSGLKFTPNSNNDGSFSIQASTANNDSGLGGTVIQATIFVNGTPSFTITPSHASNEDQGLVTVPGFATNISDGDGGTQNTSFVVSNIQQTSGNLAFTSNPAISTTGQLTYQASANTFGQATFDVLIEDDGTPPASSANQTVTINVNPAADTPGVTDASSANGVQTTSGLVISRNANDGAEVTHFKITGITNGTLYQNNGTTPITDGNFITFAQGNSGLKFTPNSNNDGSFSIQASTANNDSGLGGGVIQATIFVNGTPSFTITSSHTSNEDQGLVTVPGFATNISDGDGGTQNVSFVVSNIQQTSGNLTFTSNPAIDATGQLTYQASANTFGQATFDVLIEDDGTPPASSANQMVTINVTAVNDVPSLSGIETDPLSYTQGEAAKIITSSILVSDPDDTDLESATIQITSGYVDGEDVLTVTEDNGITGLWNAANGTLTLSGSSSLASYQTALRTVRYQNTNLLNPDADTRTVSFRVNDGSANSNIVTRNISFTAVNADPVLASTDVSALDFSEGSVATAVSPNITVTDVDNTTLQGARVRMSAAFLSSEDQLAFTGGNGISGSFNSSTGILNLSGSATIENYQSALRSVTYRNTNTTNPNTTQRTISFRVFDGEDSSNVFSRNINVIAVNDKPVLASVGSAITFTEGDVATAISPTITATDVDNASLTAARVAVTSGFNSSEDVLGFTNGSGITGNYNSTTGVLTLTGSSTVTNYQNALRAVTYQNTNNATPSTAQRTVTFRVYDGADSSDIVSKNINVVAVNDPPTASNSAVTLDEDSDYTFAASDFNDDYADPEGHAFGGIRIMTLPANGTLTLSNSPVSENDNIATANISNLEFTPNANYFGATSFTFKVRDSEGLGSTANYTMTITVTPIADTPSVTNASANEGQLNASGLVISRNAADGSEVTHFRITDITNGTLYQNNGTSVINEGVFITHAHANAGLRFRPNSHEDGSFRVWASKSNNVTGIGGGYAEAAISVNGVPKSAGISDIVVLEDAPDFPINLANVFSDAEDDDEDLIFQIMSNTNSGLFSSVTIDNLTLTFSLEPDANGSSTITLRCTDTNGAYVEEVFDFEVTPVNDPPTFSLSQNNIDQLENFAGTITVEVAPTPVPDDEQGQTVTYSLAPASVGFVNISINSSTGEISITSEPFQFGTQTFKVVANDGQAENNIVERNLTVTVGEVNIPPVFAVSGDVQAQEDFTSTLEVTVTPEPVRESEQDQVVTYAISPSSIDFANMSFDPGSGNVEFTSIPNRYGTQTFTITADDGQPENSEYSEQFQLVITPVNDPPTIDDIPSISIPIGSGLQEISLAGITPGPFEENDLGQFPISIFAFSGNSNIIPQPTLIPATILNNTQTTSSLRFVPNPAALGTVEIQVLVVDAGQQSILRSFFVEIVDTVNAVPEFTSDPLLFAVRDLQYTYEITTFDADGDDVAVSAVEIPAWLSLTDNGDGTALLTGTPVEADLGIHSVSIQIEDEEGDIAQQSFDVEVVDDNSIPEFTSEPVLFAVENIQNSYSYSITADDEDAEDDLEITVQATPGWLTFTDNGDRTATLTGTPPIGSLGEHQVRLRVTDPKGASDEQEFTVSVLPPNSAVELRNMEETDLIYPYGEDSIRVTQLVEIFKYNQGNLSRARVWISSNSFEADIDSLSAVVDGGIQVTYDNGQLSFEGQASFQVYQQALRSVRYHNRNSLRPDTARQVQVNFQATEVIGIITLTSNISSRVIEFEGQAPTLTIFTGFTPNGDNVNDTWRIGDIDLYEDATVEVYSRNGSRVFESKGVYEPWDGTLNGERLPSGTYFYFIRLNRFGITYKGSVTILK